MYKVTRVWLLALTLLLAVFPLLVPASVAAQDDPEWDVLTQASEGGAMAGDTITSLALDGNALWVGTEGGLTRYDGAVWDRFTVPHDPGDERANAVQALLLDRAGYLWVGTDKEVILLPPDRRWGERVHLPDDIHGVEVLSLGRDGGVWIGWLDGATYWPWPGADAADSRQDVRANPSDVSANVTIVAVWDEAAQAADELDAGEGAVWFGTRGDGLIRQDVDGELELYTEADGLSSAWVRALWGDEGGQLWVGTASGVCRLSQSDPGQGCQLVPELDGLFVNGFYPAPDGSLWVATSQGLLTYRFDGTPSWVWGAPGASAGADTVNALVLDGEEQLWLATNGGLVRRRATVWQSLLPPGLVPCAEDVRSVTEDDRGTLWTGTACGLRWRDGAAGWRDVQELADQPIGCLWSDEDGSVWACLERGIARVSPEREVELVTGADGPQDLEVHAIRRGPDGALWLATDLGVRRWDGSTWTAYRQDAPLGGPVNNWVYAISPSAASDLWFGTLRGLSRFDGGIWASDPGQIGCAVGDSARAIVQDARGRLWVGTNAGLVMCGGGQQWCWRGTDDVRALAIEKGAARSTLWFGTVDGLRRADISREPEEGLPIVSFSSSNGSLPDDTIQAIYVSRMGEVLIGTQTGLWAYHESKLSPQVRLQNWTEAGVVHDTLTAPGAPLRLAHTEPPDLRVRGGDLRTPGDDLLYRYVIEADQQTLLGWSETEHLSAVAPITDVLRPGGEITVNVWAYDRDFNESAAPAQLRVAKSQVPLPQQGRFLLLAGLVLLISGGSAAVFLYGRWRKWRRYEYSDVVVALHPAHPDGSYDVLVSAGGTPLLPQYTSAVDWSLLREPLVRLRAGNTDAELLRGIGRRLYDGLFIQGATEQLREQAGLGRKGVRVRLRFEDADALANLAALPWEFLHGGDELGFLTVQSNVALLRDLSPDEPEKVPVTAPPLKLLLAWATPADLTPLDVETEVQAIKDAYAELERRGRVTIIELGHAQREAFREEVKKGYDLVHFTGHGGVKSTRDGVRVSVLYFEDEDGDAVSMTQDALVTLFHELPATETKTPKLVFLNACRTADGGDIAGLAGLAETLVVEAKLAAVVGMGYPISEHAARVFVRAFYQTLERVGQVDHAVAVGREAVYVEMTASRRDWGVPRLYVRIPEGIIFDKI
jgi:ligand-binding sensor domain-containing protein